MSLHALTFSVDLDSEGQLSYSYRADGDDPRPEEIAGALLAGAEAVIRQALFQEMQEQSPLGNEEFQRETSALESRLLLMDMVCHLPAREHNGFITTIE
jgi:hypothetical protein